MAFLFNTQPLAFPNFDGFSLNLSPQQQAQAVGRALDQGYGRKHPKPMEERVVRLFKPEELEYVRRPIKDENSVSIMASGIGTY